MSELRLVPRFAVNGHARGCDCPACSITVGIGPLRLFRVTLPCAVCGVLVDERDHIQARAPYLKCFDGYKLKDLERWALRRGGKVEEVG